MNELISKEALLRLIGTMPISPTTERENRLINAFVTTVKNFPAADVVPMSWVREHMSGDYISREQAVENAIDQMRHSASETAMRERLLNLLAADVRSVVRGKWIWTVDDDEYLGEYWKCNLCGEHSYIGYNYCPNCGAMMEES